MADTKEKPDLDSTKSSLDMTGIHIIPADITQLTPENIARKDSVQCMRFNQDGSSLVVATKTGFRVFDLAQDGDVIMLYDISNLNQVLHIQRLFKSNLVAYVCASDPEVLKVFNLRRNAIICDYHYGKPIRWLGMNRVRIVVALDDKIYIQKFRNLEQMNTIENLAGNPRHLYAMATYELRSFLAFPCDPESGTLSIYDLESNTQRHRIAAHRTPIEQLVFNSHATRLATASTKGTVIRVFDAVTGIKLHELRRGFRAAILYSLSFSANGEFLACSSEHETLHVFKIPTNPEREKNESEEGWLASVGHIATHATGLISSEVERFIQEERALFTIQNPYHETVTTLNVLAKTGENKLHLQICSTNGFMNGFLVESREGGWVTDLQRAYFLTENIVQEPKVAANQRQKHGKKSRASNEPARQVPGVAVGLPA